VERAYALRDAALPLIATVRDPDTALQQAAGYLAGQLEQPLEVRARDLARDLLAAGSAQDVVELLASAAVCG